MPVFRHTVELFDPAEPGGQDERTGRPVAPSTIVRTYKGPALVDDQGSSEDIDKYGSRDATGSGLVYFKEPMERVKPRKGQLLRTTLGGMTIEGEVTAIRFLTRSAQIEWATPPSEAAEGEA